MKGIHNVGDLYTDGVLMAFSEFMLRYNIKKDNFWKYLQIRDCIVKDSFIHKDNPIQDFMDSSTMEYKASTFYKLFNNMQKDICKGLRIVWQRDLGCTFNDDEWLRILSNNGKYIKESRGKFTHYKLVHRFYFTPSRLHKMGLLTNNLCWKCKTESGTFLHAIWECKYISPFWKTVIQHIGKWIGVGIPMLPRICLLGDQTVMPNISKHQSTVIQVGMVTAARVILRLWKSTSVPNVKNWLESMLEIVSYEQMLAKLNNDTENFKKSWSCFLSCSTGTIKYL